MLQETTTRSTDDTGRGRLYDKAERADERGEVEVVSP